MEAGGGGRLGGKEGVEVESPLLSPSPTTDKPSHQYGPPNQIHQSSMDNILNFPVSIDLVN